MTRPRRSVVEYFPSKRIIALQRVIFAFTAPSKRPQILEPPAIVFRKPYAHQRFEVLLGRMRSHSSGEQTLAFFFFSVGRRQTSES